MCSTHLNVVLVLIPTQDSMSLGYLDTAGAVPTINT